MVASMAGVMVLQKAEKMDAEMVALSVEKSDILMVDRMVVKLVEYWVDMRALLLEG
jgi:hypothetical protein